MLKRVRPGLYERVPGPEYDAQAAFVAAWREQHPDQTWGNVWQCPICAKVLQASEIDPAHQEFLTVMVGKHQRFHGQDWSSYEAAGSPGAAGDEEGGDL